MFLSLEDETGIVNAVVWPSLFEKQRRVLMTASMMGIHGRIQRKVRSCISSPSVCSTSPLISKASARAMAAAARSRRPGQAWWRPGSSGQSQTFGAGEGIYAPDLHLDTLKVRSRNFHRADAAFRPVADIEGSINERRLRALISDLHGFRCTPWKRTLWF
jgi:error-prone DNA polymerase